MKNKYQAVIGLEVHVELDTLTKMYCSCKTVKNGEPNTSICPVCMGLPGALPVLNKRAVELGVTAGLVTNCKINKISRQARKHYFYPDLPKGYQISQYKSPLCSDGYITINTPEGEKRIGIERIHIEEDAGKLIHKDGFTLVDNNRCGIPLIEIVSRPHISSGKEAGLYLQTLKGLLVYAGISQCRMNMGEMRCDVNISVKPIGQKENGTRREIKNLNSFQFVEDAIENEFARQVAQLENGEIITTDTLGFDESTGTVFTMRKKESAADYRYLDEPDMPAVSVTEEQIDKLRLSLPLMPHERQRIYTDKYRLSEYDARTIVANKSLSDYFDSSAGLTKYPKQLANLLLGEYSRLNTASVFDCPVSPENSASLADMLGDRVINTSNGKKLAEMMWNKDSDPMVIAKTRNLLQINDRTVLEGFAKEAVNSSEKLVQDYKNGKKQAAKAIMGKAMQLSKGNANPVLLEEILQKLLLPLTKNDI